MDVRIRLPELLEEHSTTAYRVARDSAGRIQASNLYRLARQKGRVRFADLEFLQVLCEVLGIKPKDFSTLFELEPAGDRKAPEKRRRKAG